MTYDDLLKVVEEQKMLIDDLKTENEKLEDFSFLFQESVDLIGIMDIGGNLKSVNNSFSRILGSNADELLDENFIDKVHPDELESVYAVIYGFNLGMMAVDFESRLLCQNGKYITVQWIAKMNPDNKLIYVIGRDVTKMKATQNKLMMRKKMLNEALTLAKLGSWNYIIKDKSLFWSDETYRVLGMDCSHKERLFQTYKSKFSGNDFLKILHLNQEVPSDVKSFHFECPVQISDSVSKTIYVTGAPVYDKMGNLISFRGYLQDVTKKTLVEEAMRAQRYAEAANKAKSDFLANMSHEIRTPLNGVLGFAQLLSESILDEEQSKYLDMISQSAKSLLDIINEILDLSKIEAGKLELHLCETNLFDLTSHIIDVFSYQVSQKGIELLLDFGVDIPNRLLLDSLRIRQILVNLIGNAIKFTDRGSVKLTVRSLPMLEENVARIRFSVKDTGIGIRPANQQKIFESFEQEDSSITKRFGGTGLGLAISKKLLGLMNSKLELESSYNVGSEFSFVVNFSVVKDDVPSLECLNLSENKTDLPMSELNDMRIKILLVEDNEINTFLAKKLLGKVLPNSVVLEAKNGQEAVEMNSLHNFDLILMDVIMPVKDGYEATAEIRADQKYKDVPIVALTAGIMNDERTHCLEIGMNDFLSKPIIEDQLKDVIRKWVKAE